VHKIELSIDVSEAAGFGQPQHLAGTVFMPDVLAAGRPVVIFASPGGGYSRHYFDMHFPARAGYSEAEYHSGRGIVFVAMDHLGVGDSSTDRMDDLTVETIADANHAFVREALHRLGAGTLKSGFPAIEDPFVVGIGQSMGGGITMIMQGRHRTFHAIAPLGISAIHTTLPQPTTEQFKLARGLFMFSRQTPLDQLAISNTGERLPDFNYPFHWEDEPEEIRQADMEGGYPMRRTSPKFGSLTIPRCAVAMNSPGFFTPEVARIDVPVLMAFGERDVSADMRREATAFFNSDDISIFIVPRMAHMHNFAETRHILWQRVADWSRMQAGS
jgi:pimeloyl-ACP methyl ester carboxylesterase